MKILLACNAGMSTSILVNKMREAAKSKGIDAEIWAVPETELKNNIDKCDVLLIGPQIRHMLKEITNIATPYNVPVELIDMRHYGMCNGAKVLEQALKMK